jgi:ABC-type cobalamin/Fe3+-siderophores transport system ATPase subunit
VEELVNHHPVYVLLIGKRGCGKSTLVNKLIERYLQNTSAADEIHIFNQMVDKCNAFIDHPQVVVYHQYDEDIVNDIMHSQQSLRQSLQTDTNTDTTMSNHAMKSVVFVFYQVFDTRITHTFQNLICISRHYNISNIFAFSYPSSAFTPVVRANLDYTVLLERETKMHQKDQQRFHEHYAGHLQLTTFQQIFREMTSAGEHAALIVDQIPSEKDIVGPIQIGKLLTK